MTPARLTQTEIHNKNTITSKLVALQPISYKSRDKNSFYKTAFIKNG
jgi:hypothetical protein